VRNRELEMNLTTMNTTRITDDREVSRLLTAAVVNKRFCKLLLTNPASALASGYNGESFRLDREDKDLIVSIQAKSLAEFAKQLSDDNGGTERGYYMKDTHNRSLHGSGHGLKAVSYS
jgi:hypothetical protein